MFFVFGILLSFQVWISNRFFPLAPFFEGIAVKGFTADIIILGVLIISLLAVIISGKIIFTRCALFSLTILLLQDQLRWQPWVYLYLLILIPFAIFKENKFHFSILSCLQFMIVGVYIWSGVQKFNSNFIDNTFKNILTVFFGLEDQTIVHSLNYLGYSIPVIEVCMGLSLVIPKFRDAGVIICILTHVFILGYLSPLGINSNSVVYPWNIAMIILVTLLFFRIKNPINFWSYENIKMKVLNLTMMTLVWVLPLFSFVNLWDNYLSFSLYSDKPNRYYIAIEANEIGKIDKRLHKYFVNIKGLSGGQIIDVDKWSMDVLNVPFYPERRVFKRIASSFCELGIDEEKLFFLEIEQPLNSNRIFAFTCKNLINE